MIGDVLVLIKDQLNRHFKTLSTGTTVGVDEDKVVLLDGDQKTDTMVFKTDAVSVFIYHIEREKTVPQGDPYLRVNPNGSTFRVQPNVTINLYVLFIARFKDYEQGLHYLSRVISFFQSNTLLDQQNCPEISDNIKELVIEMVTLSVKEQSDLFAMLRTSYWPSVAYKLKTLIFADGDGVNRGAISGINRQVSL